MKIRNSARNSFRNALGLDQIMATLLVVLPTIAFSVTMLLSYWSVMQADYKLKLIANLASDFANSQENTIVVTDTDVVSFISKASTLCPSGGPIAFTSNDPGTEPGVISITVNYTTPSSNTYFADKAISTRIETYSFHDQNMSIVLTCP